MRLLESKKGLSFFAFEHSEEYQQTQHKFLAAVESMEPNNMVVRASPRAGPRPLRSYPGCPGPGPQTVVPRPPGPSPLQRVPGHGGCLCGVWQRVKVEVLLPAPGA